MTSPEKFYWVYMLLCENNTYYTGSTADVEKRYQSHVDGSGKCKYTRSFKPVKIAQVWRIEGSRGAAIKIESFIKKLSRVDKNKLVLKPDLLMNYLDVSSSGIKCEPHSGVNA